jgi:protein TonB
MSRALLLSPDDQAVSAITAVLEEMAVSCERPLDGASAALKLNSHSFDLVLVDCENLPAAKLIFDVCRRGKSGNNPVPIAIVDGRAGLPTAFRLGAELILTKPVSKDHARSTIRTAVGRLRKDEPAQPTSAPDVSSSKIAPPSEGQIVAAAAAAMAAPLATVAAASVAPTAPAAAVSGATVPDSAAPAAATPTSAAPAVEPETPQVTEVVGSALVESTLATAVETIPAPVTTAQMNAAAKEAPVPVLPGRSVPQFTPSPIAKKSIEVSQIIKTDREKASDSPSLAKLDKVETKGMASPAPVLSSFSSPRHEPSPPKRRSGPIVLLLLLLAGGAFYAAWMYQPGFREMVQPQIDRVIVLAGHVTQYGMRSQPKAPVPIQKSPKAPSAPPQPATSVTAAPVNNTSASSVSPAAGVPAAGGTAAATPATDAVAASPAVSKPVPAPAPAAENPASSGETAAPIALQHPPAMDKNVVILSSKGAEKRLAHRVPPVYPKEARAAAPEGTVVLKVVVSDTGKVANVSLIEGTPILATPAIQAVKQWRYRPYARGGRALAFQTIVLLDFQRQ